MTPPPIQLATPFPFSTADAAAHHHHLQFLEDPTALAAATTATSNQSNNTSSRSSDTAAPPDTQDNGTDGGAVVQFNASAEPLTNRRGRGRPKGSKNKPKPKTFVAVDGVDVFHSHMMEVAAGSDIASTLVNYARRRMRGVSILSATGVVSNPTFCNLAPQGGRAMVPISGTFDIASFTGTILPTGSSQTTFLTVYLAGPSGQLVGGTVMGPLIAAGPVLVMAATFTNARYEKLPLRSEEDDGEGSGGRRSDRGGGAGNSSDYELGIQQQQQQLLGQEGYGWRDGHQTQPQQHHQTSGRSGYMND